VGSIELFCGPSQFCVSQFAVPRLCRSAAVPFRDLQLPFAVAAALPADAPLPARVNFQRDRTGGKRIRRADAF